MLQGKNVNIYSNNGRIMVKLYDTDVVEFDDDVIILRTGGFKTLLTLSIMNKASIQFGLDFHVHMKDKIFYVIYEDQIHKFENEVTVSRQRLLSTI
jgi:hypothetical protein